MPPQFVYTMKGLGKVYPPDSQVLKDIWLSFLPGAKIGVLGLNGAGKSTLLKIMAGVETNFVGEAFPGQGVSIGYLQQEPRSTPRRTCAATSKKASPKSRRVLDRYDAVNAKLGEDLSPEEMDKVLDEQSKLQDRSTRPMPGISTRASTWRWTRCGCRRPTPMSRRSRAASGAAWRCAGCCCCRRTCCCSTNRPTTSTPNRWRGSSAS